MKLILLAASLLALAGCATTSNLTSLATPANVQVSIEVLGAAAAPKLTASDKAVLHAFATDVLALTAANVTSANIQALVPAIPASASQFVNPLIQVGLTEINLALAKFGEHNAQVIAYSNAVGNGLLGAGF